MNKVLRLILLFTINWCIQTQHIEIYGQTSIINNDDGTGNGRIRLSIKDREPPYNVTVNRMEITTSENVIYLAKLKTGSYTIRISSADENKEPSEFKLPIYQYIPDVYFAPIDSCIQISIDTSSQLAVPMKKIKRIQWYPKEHFSHPNSLQTKLCFTNQKIGVRFEGINDDELYQKNISIFPLINECTLNNMCDPFPNTDKLDIQALRDEVYPIKSFRRTVFRYFDKTNDYMGDLTRKFGYYDWDNVTSIENTVYIIPLRKNGKSIATSYMVFTNDLKTVHTLFVSRENLIREFRNTEPRNRSSELHAKIGLLQLVDYSYPGISDPNLISLKNIFPNLIKGELCIGNYKLIINSDGTEKSVESLDNLFSIEETDTLCDYSDYKTLPTEEDLYWDPNVSSASEAFQILMKKCCDN